MTGFDYGYTTEPDEPALRAVDHLSRLWYIRSRHPEYAHSIPSCQQEFGWRPKAESVATALCRRAGSAPTERGGYTQRCQQRVNSIDCRFLPSSEQFDSESVQLHFPSAPPDPPLIDSGVCSNQGLPTMELTLGFDKTPNCRTLVSCVTARTGVYAPP